MPGKRRRLARLFAPNSEVREWVGRPPGAVEVIRAQDPRILGIKTPRGNIYLVLSGSTCVIDPNLPGEEDLVALALEREGRTLTDLDYVACTHLHFDHASGLDSLARAAEARLLLAEVARPFVEGDEPYPYPGGRFAWPFVDIWGRVGFPAVTRRQLREGGHIGYHWSHNRVTSEVARWLPDGEPVPEMGGLIAVSGAGHAPEQLCYLHEPSGLLLAGDMYITMRGRVELNRIVVDRDRQLESDRRLRGMGLRTVCPGHGPVMSLG